MIYQKKPKKTPDTQNSKKKSSSSQSTVLHIDGDKVLQEVADAGDLAGHEGDEGFHPRLLAALRYYQVTKALCHLNTQRNTHV